ncbi:membrane protein YczE [Auraticoccus cholistanensis]|uniref:membrane protein YczE n=1 Tax=Auraticoccus cholistanensis TaxID=2656650 RepID=UPI0018D27003
MTRTPAPAGSTPAGPDPAEVPTARAQLTTLGPLAQLRAGRLPRRLLQLGGGLAVYGVSLAMLVVSGLGSAPWDVLHLGVALHTGLSLGTVIVVVSVAVLLLWIPLRQRPGLGTVANALLVGVGVDLGLALLPDQPSLVLRVVLLVAGVLLNGAATALYIGAQLGPGPRDGLMTGLARRTGRSVRLVRTVLEVGVVLVGWVLGGPVGVGTVVYALAIGPVTQAVLPWVVVALPATAAGVTPRGAASRP